MVDRVSQRLCPSVACIYALTGVGIGQPYGLSSLAMAIFAANDYWSWLLRIKLDHITWTADARSEDALNVGT